MSEFQIGQTVHIRWSEYSRDGRHQTELVPATVTKIGRKWVELDQGHERFDRTDPRLPLDGGHYSSHGRVYLSQETWQQEQARKTAWNTLRKGVDRIGPPEALTLEAIQTACEALGIVPEHR